MIWSHPRRILWLLAAATLIPIVVLGGLGVRLLRQDRDVERQRQREALDVAALRLALDIDRRLQEVEELAARGQGARFTPDGPVFPKDVPLLYHASLSAILSDDTSSPAFSEAEGAEYQRSDFAGAAAAYRRLAALADQSIRAGALLRLGRVLRKNHDRTGALEAYTDLETLGSVAVAGQPAALVARHARCRVFEESGDVEQLKQEAVELGRLLNAGGWRIDRPTFETYRDLVQRWGGPAPTPMEVARTEAAIRLWQTWRAGDLPPRGRRVVHDGAHPVFAVWTGGPERPVARLMTPGELESALGSISASHALSISGYDLDGQRLFGEAQAGSVSVMPSDSRLPFILSVAPIDPVSGGARDRMRRTVLVSGLSFAFLLMVAAAYGLYRATARELALARQQTDFVSAVSHEFRTPLTSMRHLTDLLATRGITSEERRAHYYELLAHETERLNRMVESLLSFGRIEAGGYAWKLEPLDVGCLLRDLVDEFRRDPAARTREIVSDVEGELPAIHANAEALSRALWNLLENAAKYSEPETPIVAFAKRAGSSIHVGVGDRGFGIRPGEHETIFHKFVRGADAKAAGIRGVGIGLALVKRIVEAHGGSVRVESEPGRGSTFTLVIPCSKS